MQESDRATSLSSDSTDSVSGDTVLTGERLSDNVLSSLSDAESQQSHLPNDPFEQRFVERDNSLVVLPQMLDMIYAAVEVEAVEQPHSPPLVLPQSAPASRAASKRTTNPNWRNEQGYALTARGDSPNSAFQRITSGGTARGVAARLEVQLDQQVGMQPFLRQR